MKMNISLPAELEKFVLDEVKRGHYASPDAVVVDAVARLKNDQPAWTMDKLCEEIDRGLQSLERGEGIVLEGKEELQTYFENKIKLLHPSTE